MAYFDLSGEFGGGADEQEAQVDGEAGHVHRKLAASAPTHLFIWTCFKTSERTNTENSRQIFLEKEWRGHSPNFHIHVSVSDLYSFLQSICLPILLQEICGPILGINKWLTDTLMGKLRLRPSNSQKRAT